MSAKDQIYEIIQNDPDLKYIKQYDKEWVFKSLSGICKEEGMEASIENMQKFITLLESDLWSMQESGSDGSGESLEYDYE